MMPSRLTPAFWMLSEYCRTSSFSLSRRIISFMPRMPVMGVRISWLILERNADFARLASSAVSSASLNTRLCSSALRVSESTSMKHMLTAWTMWSSRSSGWRTPAKRIIS